VIHRVNSSLVEVDRGTRKMTRYEAVCCKVSHLVATVSGPCTVGGCLALWHSGSVLVSINDLVLTQHDTAQHPVPNNEVNLCLVQLVLDE